MPRLMLAILLLAVPPQDMLAPAVGRAPTRAVVRTAADPRDARIAELEAEVAALRWQMASRRLDAPGEWRVYDANPAYEIYGCEVKGQFLYIASRRRR